MANNISQRISLEGGDDIKRVLSDIALVGEQLFQKLGTLAQRFGTVDFPKAAQIEGDIVAVSDATTDLSDRLKRVGDDGEEAAGKIGSSFAVIPKVLAGVGIAIAGTLTAVRVGIGSLANSGAEVSNDLNETAKKLKLSTDGLQALRSRVDDTDKLDGAIGNLNKTLDLAVDQAQKLGVAATVNFSRAHDAAGTLSGSLGALKVEASDLSKQFVNINGSTVTIVRGFSDASKGLQFLSADSKKAVQELQGIGVDIQGLIGKDELGRIQDVALAISKISDSSSQAALGLKFLGPEWRKLTDLAKDANTAFSDSDVIAAAGRLSDGFGKAGSATTQFQTDLKSVGVSLADIAGKDGVDRVFTLASALAKIGDPDKRAAAGIKLLGDEWKDLVELVKDGRAAFTDDEDTATAAVKIAGDLAKSNEQAAAATRNLGGDTAKLADVLAIAGVKLSDLAGKSPAEKLLTLAGVIGQIADPTKRAELGLQLLGAQYEKIIGLAGKANGFRTAAADARILDAASVKAGQSLHDANEELDKAVTFAKDKIGLLFAPSATTEAKWLTTMVDDVRKLVFGFIEADGQKKKLEEGKFEFFSDFNFGKFATFLDTNGWTRLAEAVRQVQGFSLDLSKVWSQVLLPAAKGIDSAFTFLATRINELVGTNVSGQFLEIAVVIGVVSGAFGVFAAVLGPLSFLFAPIIAAIALIGVIAARSGGAVKALWETLGFGGKGAFSAVEAESATFAASWRAFAAGDLTKAWALFRQAAVAAFAAVKNALGGATDGGGFGAALGAILKIIGLISIAAAGLAVVFKGIFGVDLGAGGVVLLGVLLELTGVFRVLSVLAPLVAFAFSAVGATFLTIAAGAIILARDFPDISKSWRETTQAFDNLLHGDFSQALDHLRAAFDGFWKNLSSNGPATFVILSAAGILAFRLISGAVLSAFTVIAAHPFVALTAAAVLAATLIIQNWDRVTLALRFAWQELQVLATAKSWDEIKSRLKEIGQERDKAVAALNAGKPIELETGALKASVDRVKDLFKQAGTALPGGSGASAAAPTITIVRGGKSTQQALPAHAQLSEQLRNDGEKAVAELARINAELVIAPPKDDGGFAARFDGIKDQASSTWDDIKKRWSISPLDPDKSPIATWNEWLDAIRGRAAQTWEDIKGSTAAAAPPGLGGGNGALPAPFNGGQLAGAIDTSATIATALEQTGGQTISAIDQTGSQTVTALDRATQILAQILGAITQNQQPLAKASGGFISGPGGPTSDSIPAYLSNGEYVVRARAVAQYGKSFLDMINNGVARFADGGWVDSGFRKELRPEGLAFRGTATVGGKAGQASGEFVIDTGDAGPPVIKQSLADQAGIESTGKIQIQGIAGAGSLDLGSAALTVAGITRQTDVVIVPDGGPPNLIGLPWLDLLRDFAISKQKFLLEAATGGHIRGPGTGTSDSILARLSNGEFVMSAKAVSHFGSNFFHALNGLKMPGLSLGGIVDGVNRSFSALALPGFAAGGLADFAPAPAAGGGFGAMHPVIINFEGRKVQALMRPVDVRDALQQAAIHEQLSSTGKAPSWE